MEQNNIQNTLKQIIRNNISNNICSDSKQLQKCYINPYQSNQDQFELYCDQCPEKNQKSIELRNLLIHITNADEEQSKILNDLGEKYQEQSKDFKVLGHNIIKFSQQLEQHAIKIQQQQKFNTNQILQAFQNLQTPHNFGISLKQELENIQKVYKIDYDKYNEEKHNYITLKDITFLNQEKFKENYQNMVEIQKNLSNLKLKTYNIDEFKMRCQQRNHISQKKEDNQIIYQFQKSTKFTHLYSTIIVDCENICQLKIKNPDTLVLGLMNLDKIENLDEDYNSMETPEFYFKLNKNQKYFMEYINNEHPINPDEKIQIKIDFQNEQNPIFLIQQYQEYYAKTFTYFQINDGGKQRIRDLLYKDGQLKIVCLTVRLDQEKESLIQYQQQ